MSRDERRCCSLLDEFYKGHCQETKTDRVSSDQLLGSASLTAKGHHLHLLGPTNLTRPARELIGPNKAPATRLHKQHIEVLEMFEMVYSTLLCRYTYRVPQRVLIDPRLTIRPSLRPKEPCFVSPSQNARQSRSSIFLVSLIIRFRTSTFPPCFFHCDLPNFWPCRLNRNKRSGKRSHS